MRADRVVPVAAGLQESAQGVGQVGALAMPLVACGIPCHQRYIPPLSLQPGVRGTGVHGNLRGSLASRGRAEEQMTCRIEGG